MSKNNFMSSMTKAAAVALVFGVVGGTAFEGTSYAFHNLAGKANTSVASTETTSEESSSNTIASTGTIQASSTSATTASTSISAVVQETMPSIVAITTMSQQEVQNFFGQTQSYESEGAGSGIIVKQDDTYLYIATNNHVVEGATTLTVQFDDDSTASATIRGTDSSDDLAVIQVALADLNEDTRNNIKIATLGDSTALSVGDTAIAIGNALGSGQSVTTGVISALEREVSIQDETSGQTVTNNLLQTDAAINPGNSGGALINAAGEVIGINSSKYSDTSVEGMGFAIPMSTAQPILEDLIANGKTTTTGAAYLGIDGVDVSSDVAKSYNMPEGVYVSQVIAGSGAEAAGIVQGNVITAFNGEAIATMSELQAKIKKCSVGDQVTITVQTADNGSYTSKDVTATLTSSSSTDSSSTESSQNNNQSQDSQNNDQSQNSEQSQDQNNNTQNSDPSQDQNNNAQNSDPSQNNGQSQTNPFSFFGQ